jgi:hypothetical protein
MADTSDHDNCDRCNRRVAIYIEKKRRRGKLTRDRMCASCLQGYYGEFGRGPEDVKRIRKD